MGALDPGDALNQRSEQAYPVRRRFDAIASRGIRVDETSERFTCSAISLVSRSSIEQSVR